jgi:hypothetical protein
MLELAVERMRLSPAPLPVIVVGGGSILVGNAIGAFEVVKPPHFAVANAVGVAIAQVSGEVDRIYALGETSRAVALIAAGIGGANAMEPMLTAARAGIPVVDGDGMGRAFPEVQMMTYLIYGDPATPAAIADEKGNRIVIRNAVDMF